jgi:predicted site-specific integrase-resolvase
MINQAQDGDDDARQDVVALITSCSARRYGRRRASRKNTPVFTALEGTGCA